MELPRPPDLHLRPEARHPLREKAEAPEHAARSPGPEADQPLLARETRQRGARLALARAEATRKEAEELARAICPPERTLAPEHDLRWVPWLAAGLLLALGAWWAEHGPPAPPRIIQAAPDAGLADEAELDLADASVLIPLSVLDSTPLGAALRLELPLAPLPEQRRPPCSKNEVELQDGCWSPALGCPGYAYVRQGGCYVPVFSPPRLASSDQSGTDG